MRAPWAVLFFVSLAANLALGGVLVGQYLRTEQVKNDIAREAVMRVPNVRNLITSLPPERAAQMRQRLAEEMRRSRPQRMVARDARRALGEVMQKEPFDPVAARVAYARVRAADADVAARFHDASIQVFATMTVEERSAAIEALKRPPRGGGFGKGPGKGGKRGEAPVDGEIPPPAPNP